MFDVGTNKGPHNGNLASVPNFGTVNTKMITSLIVIPRFLKKKKKKIVIPSFFHNSLSLSRCQFFGLLFKICISPFDVRRQMFGSRLVIQQKLFFATIDEFWASCKMFVTDFLSQNGHF